MGGSGTEERSHRSGSWRALRSATACTEEEDMLVLTRKAGECIVINGDIRVVVLSLEGNKCRLGVMAPLAVPVHRQEVYEKIKALPDDPSTFAFTGKTTG